MVLEEDSELITEERIIALRDNVKKKNNINNNNNTVLHFFSKRDCHDYIARKNKTMLSVIVTTDHL